MRDKIFDLIDNLLVYWTREQSEDFLEHLESELKDYKEEVIERVPEIGDIYFREIDESYFQIVDIRSQVDRASNIYTLTGLGEDAWGQWDFECVPEAFYGSSILFELNVFDSSCALTMEMIEEGKKALIDQLVHDYEYVISKMTVEELNEVKESFKQTLGRELYFPKKQIRETRVGDICYLSHWDSFGIVFEVSENFVKFKSIHHDSNQNSEFLYNNKFIHELSQNFELNVFDEFHIERYARTIRPVVDEAIKQIADAMEKDLFTAGQCDCGAEKHGWTHSNWCSKENK